MEVPCNAEGNPVSFVTTNRVPDGSGAKTCSAGLDLINKRAHRPNVASTVKGLV
jgi:hypothetical protein